MEIYKYITGADGEFTCFSLAKRDASFRKLIRSGESLKSGWEPIHLIDDGRYHHGDFLLMMGAGLLLFSCRAWSLLEPLIGNDTEALPVSTDSGVDLLAIHLLSTAEVDCLDKENSKIVYSKLDGRPMSVKKYVFREEMIQDKILFKVPETAHFETFVTEKFKTLVEQEKLTGLTLQRMA